MRFGTGADTAGAVGLASAMFAAMIRFCVPDDFFFRQSEQPEAALRRELREEIGIEVRDVELLFARTLSQPPQIEFYFRARAIGRPEPCSFEIKSAGWFSVDDLPAELSKDQRRLIRRALTPSENSYQ